MPEGLLGDSPVHALYADAAYMREQLTDPLGMTDTTFGLPEDGRERYAAALPADPLIKETQELPDLSIARFHSGGAGLVGTAADYLSFVQFLLEAGMRDRRHLLGRKTVEYMLTDQLPPCADEPAGEARLESGSWLRSGGCGASPARRFGRPRLCWRGDVGGRGRDLLVGRPA